MYWKNAVQPAASFSSLCFGHDQSHHFKVLWRPPKVRGSLKLSLTGQRCQQQQKVYLRVPSVGSPNWIQLSRRDVRSQILSVLSSFLAQNHQLLWVVPRWPAPCILIRLIFSANLGHSRCCSWPGAMTKGHHWRTNQKSFHCLPCISAIAAPELSQRKTCRRMWILIIAPTAWRTCPQARPCYVECDAPNAGNARCVPAPWRLALPTQLPRSKPTILPVAIVGGVLRVTQGLDLRHFLSGFSPSSDFWPPLDLFQKNQVHRSVPNFERKLRLFWVRVSEAAKKLINPNNSSPRLCPWSGRASRDSAWWPCWKPFEAWAEDISGLQPANLCNICLHCIKVIRCVFNIGQNRHIMEYFSIVRRTPHHVPLHMRGKVVIVRWFGCLAIWWFRIVYTSCIGTCTFILNILPTSVWLFFRYS